MTKRAKQCRTQSKQLIHFAAHQDVRSKQPYAQVIDKLGHCDLLCIWLLKLQHSNRIQNLFPMAMHQCHSIS